MSDAANHRAEVPRHFHTSRQMPSPDYADDAFDMLALGHIDYFLMLRREARIFDIATIIQEGVNRRR